MEIEYTKEAATGGKEGATSENPDAGGGMNETVTSKIVEIQIVTSTEEIVEDGPATAKAVSLKEESSKKGDNPSPAQGSDQEVVVVYGEEEFETSLKSDRSLLEEIEKELNDSYEILINVEEGDETEETENDAVPEVPK